jgi:hypothetical protein
VPGLFGNSGQSSAQKNLTNIESSTAQLGENLASTTLPAATSALQGPLNFFQALLSGDRKTIMSALSPEISTLSSQYNTGRQTAEEFAPRGGGRAAALQSLPFEESGQIENLVQGAQTEGATGVTQIAQLMGELGLGELGASTGAATSANQAIQSSVENQQQQQAATGTAIGSLIGLLVGA